MDEAGRHHPLRRGKEALTTPWRSVQNAEKANGTVAWQALPCRFDALGGSFRQGSSKEQVAGSRGGFTDASQGHRLFRPYHALPGSGVFVGSERIVSHSEEAALWRGRRISPVKSRPRQLDRKRATVGLVRRGFRPRLRELSFTASAVGTAGLCQIRGGGFFALSLRIDGPFSRWMPGPQSGDFRVNRRSAPDGRHGCRVHVD
jgi:hypothetical protein